MSKPSSAYRGLQSCRDMLSNQFTPKYGENFDGYLDAMRDALDWMRWAERKIEHLEALSHAAGQDGEQCRAALGDRNMSRIQDNSFVSMEWETVDFLGHAFELDSLAKSTESQTAQRIAETSSRLLKFAHQYRALSRGVPEDTKRLDWLTEPDAIDRHVSQCLNGEWCAQDDVVSAHYGATPREAIDAAIAAQRKEG